MARGTKDRSRKRKEMLAEAMKKPGVATAMDVLGRWQQLDETAQRIRLSKPKVRIISAIGTSG